MSAQSEHVDLMRELQEKFGLLSQWEKVQFWTYALMNMDADTHRLTLLRDIFLWKKRGQDVHRDLMSALKDAAGELSPFNGRRIKVGVSGNPTNSIYPEYYFYTPSRFLGLKAITYLVGLFTFDMHVEGKDTRAATLKMQEVAEKFGTLVTAVRTRGL